MSEKNQVQEEIVQARDKHFGQISHHMEELTVSYGEKQWNN